MHVLRVQGTLPRRSLIVALLVCVLLAATGPATSVRAAEPGTWSFQRTWSRTDKLVADRAVQRTWMWGPAAHTVTLTEPYADSPNGQRVVQYFDKSRMEITDPWGDPNNIWYVTNGLLVTEMVTGQLQTGNHQFEHHAPAQVNVAGDADDPSGPTYATISVLRGAPAHEDGAVITQRVDRSGNVTNDDALAHHNVTAAHRVQVPGIDHQIASPFWAFMNSSGTVFEGGQTIHATLFQNPFYATGLPIAEAYWAHVKVGGTYRDVLMQCFERRCLTYTPGNPAEWQVEAGNVGLHYAAWRYGGGWQPASPAPRATDGKAMLLGVSGNAFPWEHNFETYSALLNESNVGRARLELRWDYIQPSRTTWNWGLYDNLVDGYVAQGIEPYGLLGYSVGWASGGSGSGTVFGPPHDMDAWENYVFQTVNRYKDRVHAWEIWNEPDVAFFWGGRDGGDPVVYAEMLRRAHRAAKKADPNAFIISGGVTGTERGANFIHRLLDQGAAGYMDAVGIHGYISDDGFDHNIYPDLIWPLISNARERSGKPIWVTEVGWNTACSGHLAACNENEQALRIIKNVTMLFAIGHVDVVSVFQFKDPGDNPNYFGIVQNTGAKRQAYVALQTLADRLTGLHYAGRVDRGGGVWAMRFSGPDRTVEVIWSTAGDTVVGIDSSGYANAFVFALSGAWSYQPAQGGPIQVPINGTPILVELSH